MRYGLICTYGALNLYGLIIHCGTLKGFGLLLHHGTLDGIWVTSSSWLSIVVSMRFMTKICNLIRL